MQHTHSAALVPNSSPALSLRAAAHGAQSLALERQRRDDMGGLDDTAEQDEGAGLEWAIAKMDSNEGV